MRDLVADSVVEENEPNQHGPSAEPDHLHIILVVSDFDASVRRALRFAEAHHPRSLVALNACTDGRRTDALVKEWASRRIDVPLHCAQPTSEDPDPVVNYVDTLRCRDPASVVMVVFPAIAVARGWQRSLHRLDDPTLARRLSRLDRVLIAEVPWQFQH